MGLLWIAWKLFGYTIYNMFFGSVFSESWVLKHHFKKSLLSRVTPSFFKPLFTNPSSFRALESARKVILPQHVADDFAAKCLDSSPAGYYLSSSLQEVIFCWFVWVLHPDDLHNEKKNCVKAQPLKVRFSTLTCSKAPVTLIMNCQVAELHPQKV